MNVDLGHRITGGLFELVELKLGSDTPYDAALQVLRYGAIYMLYRLEPELSTRFRNEMTRAEGIVLEVLAPRGYYSLSDVDLPALEKQLIRVSDVTDRWRHRLGLRSRPEGSVFRPR